MVSQLPYKQSTSYISLNVLIRLQKKNCPKGTVLQQVAVKNARLAGDGVCLGLGEQGQGTCGSVQRGLGSPSKEWVVTGVHRDQ